MAKLTNIKFISQKQNKNIMFSSISSYNISQEYRFSLPTHTEKTISLPKAIQQSIRNCVLQLWHALSTYVPCVALHTKCIILLVLYSRRKKFTIVILEQKFDIGKTNLNLNSLWIDLCSVYMRMLNDDDDHNKTVQQPMQKICVSQNQKYNE